MSDESTPRPYNSSQSRLPSYYHEVIAPRLAFLERGLDGHMREILSGTSVALLLKAAGAVLTFGLYVAIGRLLGSDLAGMYFLALAVATVAAVLGRLGLDNTTLRFIAASAAVKDWASVRGVYRQTLLIGILGSSAATLIVAGLAPLLAEHLFGTPGLTGPTRWMALSIVPGAAVTLVSRGLLGLKRVRDAALVQDVAIPAITLTTMGFLVPHWGLLGAVWAYIIAASSTLLLALWRWRAATVPLRVGVAAVPAREVIQSSIPLFWVACLQLAMTWTSTLVLGMWASSADVGIFSVASRTATLTSFILLAVNTAAAPKFAALYRLGDLATLGQLARNCTKLMGWSPLQFSPSSCLYRAGFWVCSALILHLVLPYCRSSQLVSL